MHYVNHLALYLRKESQQQSAIEKLAEEDLRDRQRDEEAGSRSQQVVDD